MIVGRWRLACGWGRRRTSGRRLVKVCASRYGSGPGLLGLALNRLFGNAGRPARFRIGPPLGKAHLSVFSVHHRSSENTVSSLSHDGL